jgi:hypothetical protein
MMQSMCTVSLVLVAVCAIACGGSHAAGASGGTTADAGKPDASDARAKGPAPSSCDDYVRIVTECIETKMPESDRAHERQNLAIFRKNLAQAATPPSAMCEANIRTAIRQDSDGCYEAEAAKRGIQTACTLVAHAELEEILHAPLDHGVTRDMQCSYAFASEPFREPLKIGVHWKGGHDEMEAARGGQAIVNGRLAKETGQSDLVPGAGVDGVGDDAFFTVAGVWPMLAARLGDVSVTIEGADRDQLIAIARKALPRIEPEPDDPS